MQTQQTRRNTQCFSIVVLVCCLFGFEHLIHMHKNNFLNLWFVDHRQWSTNHRLYESLSYIDELILISIWKFLKCVSLYMAFFFVFVGRDTMHDSIQIHQIFDQLKVSHLLNLNSGSLTDSLLGRGVTNGPLKFLTARKILPLLDLLAKFKRVLACSCSLSCQYCSKFCKSFFGLK